MKGENNECDNKGEVEQGKKCKKVTRKQPTIRLLRAKAKQNVSPKMGNVGDESKKGKREPDT